MLDYCTKQQHAFPSHLLSKSVFSKDEQTQISLPPLTGHVLQILYDISGPLLNLNHFFNVFLVVETQYAAYLYNIIYLKHILLEHQEGNEV